MLCVLERWQRVTVSSSAALRSKPFSFQSGKRFDISRSLGSVIGFEVCDGGLFRAVSFYISTYAILPIRTCSILLKVALAL